MNDRVEDNFTGRVYEPTLWQLIFTGFNPNCKVRVRILVRTHGDIQETSLVVLRTLIGVPSGNARRVLQK